MKPIRSTPWTRRTLLLSGAGTALTAGPLAPTAHASGQPGPAVAELRALEREHGARLGVFAWNTSTNETVLHRAGERFPICSLFKTVAVAAVLRDLDRDGTYLRTTIRYTRDDIAGAGHVPVTGLPQNLEQGMTVEELCAATITFSDNGAANLLLRELGGPAAITRFCRSLGDDITRLDRWEPDLNSAEPDRITDTTTPLAIGRTYARLTLTRALGTADRERLTGWLLANTTGDRRLRAGLPADWRVAEKTGSGSYGTTNDAGIAWPPGRGPVVLAVLATKPADAQAPADEPLLAKTARIVSAALG